MEYKRILTIQDISCVGQCSLTVALPILSACGHETAILPSAVLSTHTSGFQGFTVRDISSDMPAIREHWEKENIFFDAIYTGYLGSKEQMGYVADIFRSRKGEGGKIIVDPAMGDHGNLYFGFDLPYAKEMAKLCGLADIILPNVTEACYMTDHPYKEEYDRAYIDELLVKLHALGCPCVVLTGIGFEPGMTGVLVSNSGKVEYYCHKKLPQNFHGTGDVFSSSFVGSLMQGKSLIEASQIAADFTVRAMEATIGDDKHWYGVKFETVLGSLIDALK